MVSLSVSDRAKYKSLHLKLSNREIPPMAPVATCKKRRFTSERQAEEARWAMLRRPHTGKLPCRSYHCATCGGWHWTSMPLRTP
jgi:hypothetical protein